MQTLSSVLWKYWRYKFQRGSPHPSEKQVWTDLSHSGDGFMTGQPRENTESLATFLTSTHCFGHIGSEKVYRETDVDREIGAYQPMVLKVKIEPLHHRENNRLTRLDVLKQMFEVTYHLSTVYCGAIN